ncbi:MAG: 50S ribosomal protein L25/general stress protein Ctc [Prevotellaceae bacterium]|jgi:large subunit ribosomal protein L25|nr:50S ribosomal protein L25/general stress protein Ctc [Prevotellaceae bacterium]
MKSFNLQGKTRKEVGKKATKAVRVAENVPCVLYGGEKNVHFTATERDLHKLIYTPEVFVVHLNIDGFKTHSVMKEIQFHPVSDRVLHIDFLEVTADKPVVVELPVKLTGLAEGVRAGGKLSLEMRKLRVKGIYTKIPENVTLDVTDLALGKSIQVEKISIPDLEIMNAKNAVVAQVKLTRAARGAAAAAASAEAKSE